MKVEVAAGVALGVAVLSMVEVRPRVRPGIVAVAGAGSVMSEAMWDVAEASERATASVMSIVNGVKPPR